jgi:membrane protein
MSSLLERLDAAQRRVPPVAFVVAVFRKAGEDQAGYLSTVLSFYAFLAIFPLLLVLATVLGIVLSNDTSAQQTVMHSALTDFPVIGTQLRANVHSLDRTGVGLSVGLVGTVLGARGLSTSAQLAFNTIWGIPYARRGSWFHRQGRGLALLSVIALDVLVAGTLSSVSGVGDGHALWVEWIGAVGATLVNAALFTLGFRLAMARVVPTRGFVRAACATAVVWQALLSLGSYLVDHELRNSEDLYGVFGVVLGLLAWLHIQARVTVLVLEADCVRERKLWPRTLDGPKLVPADMQAYTSYAQMQQRRDNVHISVSYEADYGADYAPAGISQLSAGTRVSTPSKSVPAARVPKAKPRSPSRREAQKASATEDGA